MSAFTRVFDTRWRGVSNQRAGGRRSSLTGLSFETRSYGSLLRMRPSQKLFKMFTAAPPRRR